MINTIDTNKTALKMTQGVTVTFKQLIDIKQQLIKSRFQSNALIRSMHKGNHQLSVYKGRGMEFAESRLYQSGDDMRHIDWRVSARTGQLHTKLFQEERELPVSLLLDLRSQMFFGSRNCFKSYLASHLAALFAWESHNSQSHLVAQIIGVNDCHLHKLSKTKTQLLALLKRIAELNDFNGNYVNDSLPSLSLSLKKTRQMTPIDSLLYVISDFSDMNEHTLMELRKCTMKNTVICIQITDDLDQSLPHINAQITDGNKKLNLLQLNRQQLAVYSQRFLANQQKLIEACQTNNIVYHCMNTADYTGDLYGMNWYE